MYEIVEVSVRGQEKTLFTLKYRFLEWQKNDKKGVPLPFFTQLFVNYTMTGTGSEYPLASQVRLEKPTFVISPIKLGVLI